VTLFCSGIDPHTEDTLLVLIALAMPARFSLSGPGVTEAVFFSDQQLFSFVADLRRYLEPSFL
jgi:hypothetical protein